VKQFESLVVDGAGEGGAAVRLSAEDQARVAAAEKIYAFNKVAGDKVSLWRGLKDVRSSQCKGMQQDVKLPRASVVIIFNNEVLSSLLRTVWSVLDRTPKELLHEVGAVRACLERECERSVQVVLVDDASNHTDISLLLPQYIQARLPPKVPSLSWPV
jgi:polypeptide N-acetylgalactosaminyltransferase